MKALIRNNSDPILETMNIPFINWNTGAPLTNPDWFGGPYILVNDYIPEDPADDFVLADDGATYGRANPSAASQPADPTPAAASTQDPAADTIVIDGVVYRRA